MKFSKVILAGLLFVALTGCEDENIETGNNEEMTNLEFFQSLNYDDPVSVIEDICDRFPLQYGTTCGSDHRQHIRPLEFKFSEDGVLYFDTVDYYSSYQEMKENPYIEVCIGDHETMSYLRFGGTVNFTNIINRCFAESSVLTSQFGDNRSHVVAYYLTDAWAEF